MARKAPSLLNQPVCYFVVFGSAAPAGSKTAGISKAGKLYVRDSSKGSYQWKQQVADKAAESMGGEGLVTGPLEIWFTFFVPRPKSHYGTGRNADKLKPSAPFSPTGRPDCLKLARAVEDALTGVVWRDDSQIVSEHLRKFYGEPARVDIRVEHVFDRYHRL